jgi:hypothetical protein
MAGFIGHLMLIGNVVQYNDPATIAYYERPDGW